jgi:predicted metalloprotease with PDZ domain
LDPILRGTDDPPLEALLADFGVRFCKRAAEGGADRGGKKGKKNAEQLAKTGDLGVKAKGTSAGVRLIQVWDGGAARSAGLSAGDVVVAVNGLRVTGGQLLSSVAGLGAGAEVELHAFRRDELMTFTVTLKPPAMNHVYLELMEELSDEAAARRAAWLRLS